MLPNQELLLRHAIQFFNMKGSTSLRETRLDDLEQFLEDLPKLAPDEQSIVLQVHLLCEMFDGDLDKSEFDYWIKIFQVVHPGTVLDKYALQQVAREFRKREFIRAAHLKAAIQPGAKGKRQLEIWHNVTVFLLA